MAQSTTIHLLTGDYVDRLNELYAAAQAAKDDEAPRTLGEEHPYDVLAREYAELKAESERDGITVGLEAVGRKAWREIRGAHPPRTEGDEETIKGDRNAGLNTDAAEDDVVHASLVEPKRAACAHNQSLPLLACTADNPCAKRPAFDKWVDALSEGEFQTVLLRAWSLANVSQFDPKSLPALPTQSSGTK